MDLKLQNMKGWTCSSPLAVAGRVACRPLSFMTFTRCTFTRWMRQSLAAEWMRLEKQALVRVGGSSRRW